MADSQPALRRISERLILEASEHIVGTSVLLVPGTLNGPNLPVRLFARGCLRVGLQSRDPGTTSKVIS